MKKSFKILHVIVQFLKIKACYVSMHTILRHTPEKKPKEICQMLIMFSSAWELHVIFSSQCSAVFSKTLWIKDFIFVTYMMF